VVLFLCNRQASRTARVERTEEQYLDRKSTRLKILPFALLALSKSHLSAGMRNERRRELTKTFVEQLTGLILDFRFWIFDLEQRA